MGEKIIDDKTIALLHPGTVGVTIGARVVWSSQREPLMAK
jgi:hypothetical protein